MEDLKDYLELEKYKIEYKKHKKNLRYVFWSKFFSSHIGWLVIIVLETIIFSYFLSRDFSQISSESAEWFNGFVNWLSAILSIFLALASIIYSLYSGISTSNKVDKITEVYKDFQKAKDDLIEHNQETKMVLDSIYTGLKKQNPELFTQEAPSSSQQAKNTGYNLKNDNH